MVLMVVMMRIYFQPAIALPVLLSKDGWVQIMYTGLSSNDDDENTLQGPNGTACACV